MRDSSPYASLSGVPGVGLLLEEGARLDSKLNDVVDDCLVLILVSRNDEIEPFGRQRLRPRMMFGVPNSRTLVKLEKPFVPWSGYG